MAQTGPDLLVRPWATDQAVDASADSLFESSSHTDGGDSVQMDFYHGLGRWRLIPDSDASPILGFDALEYTTNTKNPALPGRLLDLSVGFAQPIADVEHWFVALTGAVGYAGDRPLNDGKAVYTSDNIIVGRKYSEDKAFILALNYNGNRTFLPDCPIPGFAFADRFNSRCTYVLGLPYSSVEVMPATGLQVDFNYDLLETFGINVAYGFTKHFALFGQYLDQYNPFHIYGTQTDRRLFFESHQAGLGVRWSPTKLIHISLSGGWAFGQEFTEGWDSRNYTVIRHIDDAPYAKVRVEIGF